MIFKGVDIPKIVEELSNILVENDVPIEALDTIMDKLKNTVYINTHIQNQKYENKSRIATESLVQEENKFIPEDSNQKHYTSEIGTKHTCVDRFKDVTSFIDEQLFAEYEKDKAESILLALEGLSIDSAIELLNKCQLALTQIIFHIN